MNELPFDQVIANSPVLSSEVKEMILESAGTLPEESKQAIIEKLLKYESDVSLGTEQLLTYLGHGPEA